MDKKKPKNKEGSFIEPDYVRKSLKNTFLTRKERDDPRNPKNYYQIAQIDSSISNEMEEIMLRTKATGITVEAYF